MIIEQWIKDLILERDRIIERRIVVANEIKSAQSEFKRAFMRNAHMIASKRLLDLNRKLGL